MFKPHLRPVMILIFAVLLLPGCSPSAEQKSAASQPAKLVEKTEIENCLLTPPKEPIACTMQYDPVCGCDGKTYGNACSARGAGVPHSTPGACGEKAAD